MAPTSRIVVSNSPSCRSNGVGTDERVDHGEYYDTKVLNLMMICCEENAPYGPARDTATMFLELLCAAYECHQRNTATNSETKGNQRADITIRITIYHAQALDYPQTPSEWDSYNGIIIPGSLSAAYDTHIEWIHRLLTVIQTEIHEKQRKTLGVCFGHQCFAHSFQMANNKNQQLDGSTQNEQGGFATQCSIGPIAGRRSFKLTSEGQILLGSTTSQKYQITDQEQQPKEFLEMLYTRGDMVHSLPSVALSLCGSADLPNEVCAYFASDDDVANFRTYAKLGDVDSGTSWRRKLLLENKSDVALPYAITFQAHPEYMTQTGTKVNYINTVKAMEERRSISADTCREACEEMKQNYESLSQDCLDATVSAGILLGWFD